MVLGLKSKSKKSPHIQFDYIINLIEIKPWPPSHSLRSLRSALIQWEHGDKNSGSTKPVAPLILSASGVGDGKIVFNESFRVHVTLWRDPSRDNETFLRNCIEFNMYEPRRDKTVKGPLLASAVMDFAEYGIVEGSLMTCVPMNCKRTYGNTAQPMLFVKIHMVERDDCVMSSYRKSLIREESVDKNRSESVSALMVEEYAEEAETASIIDDDISSQSSKENGYEAICGTSEKVSDKKVSVQDKRAAYEKHILSSKDLSALSTEVENARTTLSNIRNSRFTMLPRTPISHNGTSGQSCIQSKVLDASCIQSKVLDASESGQESETSGDFEVGADRLKNVKSVEYSSDSCLSNGIVRTSQVIDKLKKLDGTQSVQESKTSGDFGFNADRLKNVKYVESSSDSCLNNGSVTTSKVIDKFKIFVASQESQTSGDSGFNADRLKTVKCVGSSSDLCLSNGSVRSSKVRDKLKNVGVHDQNSGSKDVISKVQHLEQRVRDLEDELTETAAIEFSIYSVVAEHGSSIRKVHASARRLSRLYFHASKDNSLRRSNSARGIVSGLILVAKACGNDVARLTFWLSNAVVLRAIIHKSIDKDSCLDEDKSCRKSGSDEPDDPRVVTSDLEKVESWIFSRIVESIWWQTLAPYMQSTAAKGVTKVIDSESSKSCQTTTSFELWKKAFNDVGERICPIRAAGHNCGCLSVLSMLIMEQCVSRLDVAMFNAILREPGDEVPTDPVSDPISDSKVLPIPSGKASVGAGALLKRTVGNWSSWLTDLFGSPITFHLLTALSELMMLPKDMILSNTIRKEVCPTFGVPLIKRILDNFTPDEFCPDPLPDVVLETLDSEDLIESGEDCVMSLPCAAAPIVYHPPSASLIGCIVGDDGNPARLSRSGSSILGKSNTSDDELDELDSPLTSIVDCSRAVAASVKPVWSLKNVDSCNNIRYRLLREMWMNSD